MESNEHIDIYMTIIALMRSFSRANQNPKLNFYDLTLKCTSYLKPSGRIKIQTVMKKLIRKGVFLSQNQYHDDSSSCPDPQNS